MGNKAESIIPDWCALTTYQKGCWVLFDGECHEANLHNLVGIVPGTESIRILVDTHIERRFLSTEVTKEYEVVRPWIKVSSKRLRLVNL